VLNDEETFLEPSWIALFLGQGLKPRRYHPMADQFPMPALEKRLAQVQAVMRRAAEAMPPHGQVLAQLGGRP
jgi:tryptophan halogenase